MFRPKSMTAEEEVTARAQAFYLLKKFTSFTFLDKAAQLYDGFLLAFAAQLSEPRNANYIGAYKAYLGYAIPFEEAVYLLRHTPHKVEAYRRLDGCTRPISNALFGRNAHEMGISYEPFFQSLGMQEEDSNLAHVSFVRDVLTMKSMIFFCWCTTLGRIIFDDKLYKIVMAFNYGSIFNADCYRPASAQRASGLAYIYPFNFPSPLPPGPARNTRSKGQVWTGETIPVTGIYEPWFMDGVTVGCPNFFLAGQEAIEYQMEGTQDKEMVAWRLIWEDRRYLDGSVPAEEVHYLREPPPESALSVPPLSAKPGQPCPKAGRWFAPHLGMKEVEMKLGEPMPSQMYGATGGVTWYLKA